MNLLFPKKKLVIKAYTYNSCAYTNFSVARAHSFYPEWWKKLAPTYKEQQDALSLEWSTMKRCTGVIDNYKHGIIVPMWSDVKLRVMEDGSWVGKMADTTSRPMESHPTWQWQQQDNPEFNHLVHIKFVSPWVFEDVNKTGVEFIMSGCYWNHLSLLDYLHICPGVINFKFQHGVHINAFLSKTPREFLIPANTPMIHLIPITQRPLELQVELVDFSKWAQINDRFSAPSVFNNKYQTFKKIQIEKERKCPFGFLHAKS